MQFLIHRDFELNDISFRSKEELLIYSKSISDSLFSFLEELLNDSNYVIVKTSGSTGTPKLIQIKKEFLINSAQATGYFFKLDNTTKALLCMNPEYIAGKMMLVRALVLGWKLDVVSPTSTPLKGNVKIYDFAAMVPLQVAKSIGELKKIKKLIVGGGQVSKSLQEKLQDVPTEIFATYGMTETVTHIAVKSINNKKLKTKNYQTLPNVKVSSDKRGCLVIDAPKVSSEKVVTNDLVKIISNKEFKWLGRYDTIINSGGIKLIPEQIEEKLTTVIKERFFISSLSDETLGEKLILIVEGKKQDYSFSNLSKYEKPKEVYFLDSFIETETKKIQRKETLKLIFN
ncbi:AMP-binding protein [Urechidicola croceus]|nr:AMP-binding protein [Urechidicola croceus]